MRTANAWRTSIRHPSAKSDRYFASFTTETANCSPANAETKPRRIRAVSTTATVAEEVPRDVAIAGCDSIFAEPRRQRRLAHGDQAESHQNPMNVRLATRTLVSTGKHDETTLKRARGPTAARSAAPKRRRIESGNGVSVQAELTSSHETN